MVLLQYFGKGIKSNFLTAVFVFVLIIIISISILILKSNVQCQHKFCNNVETKTKDKIGTLYK